MHLLAYERTLGLKRQGAAGFHLAQGAPSRDHGVDQSHHLQGHVEVRQGVNLIIADAHLKRTIMGREVVVAVTEGRLDLGPWEQFSMANSMASVVNGH